LPDRDIFNEHAEPGWARPLRWLYGDAEPADVGRLCLKALRRTLKTGGGLPAGQAIGGLLEKCSRGVLEDVDALKQIHRICAKHLGYANAHLAVRTAERIVQEITDGMVTTDFGDRFGVGFCEELLRHHLAKKAPLFLRESKSVGDLSALNARISECLTEIGPGLEQIARQLAVDPTARALKLPPSSRRRVRKTTAELLNQPL